MTSLYSTEHRQLQEEFNTTKLADLLDNGWVHEKISDAEQQFIATRDMFFLSTVDPHGMPTVSYKGGPEGFVRVLDESTLVFPGYDGNGMFYSVGNIEGQGKIGMLFIDFETPHRVRVQGLARLVRDHALMAEYAEAKYLIFVDVSKIWVNCPRYIHRYKRVESSGYVPKTDCPTPMAVWKKLDAVNDVISDEERLRVAAEGGMITMEEYEVLLQKGKA